MGHYEPKPSYGVLVQSVSSDAGGAGRRAAATRPWGRWLLLLSRWSRRGRKH